ITLIWMLANMLYLPAVNHLQSYRTTAAALAAQLPHSRTCIASHNLSDPQRAMLDYFAQLLFMPVAPGGASGCEWLLTQGGSEKPLTLDANWQLVWQGARPRDEAEQLLRLYRRQSR
ncbi:MAG: glycosyltransferase, partial [Burkholderiales bacterium]|nr:glycosyltransferase [Burkholderiales bacterium]